MMTRPSMYSRPQKPLWIPVQRRESFDEIKPGAMPEPVTVDAATECHVTPNDVAARMVDYLGPLGDYLTLEPSAGTGQLVRALLAKGHSRYELTMIERHNKLASNLRPLGPALNRCFLEYAAEVKGKVEFPRIIMNPPFSQVRQHMNAAISLMGKNGHAEPACLVALVPITYTNPQAETLEELPSDTFRTAKVNTKIIRVTRS